MKKCILYFILGLVLFGLPFIAYTSEEYAGAKKCKVCHIKIYKSWRETPHAKAMESLEPGVKTEEKRKAGLDAGKDYSNDPACIACHTTGSSPSFAGIQCEACHGPGKSYSATRIMNKVLWKKDPEKQLKLAREAGLIVKPEEKTCTGCHNEKSPTFKPFDYTQRYETVKHPKQ